MKTYQYLILPFIIAFLSSVLLTGWELSDRLFSDEFTLEIKTLLFLYQQCEILLVVFIISVLCCSMLNNGVPFEFSSRLIKPILLITMIIIFTIICSNILFDTIRANYISFILQNIDDNKGSGLYLVYVIEFIHFLSYIPLIYFAFRLTGKYFNQLIMLSVQPVVNTIFIAKMNKSIISIFSSLLLIVIYVSVDLHSFSKTSYWKMLDMLSTKIVDLIFIYISMRLISILAIKNRLPDNLSQIKFEKILKTGVINFSLTTLFCLPFLLIFNIFEIIIYNNIMMPMSVYLFSFKNQIIYFLMFFISCRVSASLVFKENTQKSMV